MASATLSVESVVPWKVLRRAALVAERQGEAAGGHAQRMGRLAGRLAIEVGLDTIDAALIAAAARFHDIGKIAIASHLLLKPGPLCPDERAVMQRHAELGADLLDGHRSSLLKLASSIALTHHERWDGLGYPGGLQGCRINLAGRIVAVADAWDAMTHDRPYQPARGPAAALEESRAHAGTQFDPTVAAALIALVPRVLPPLL